MQHNISGLEPSTKYEFILAGVNAVGTGEQVKMEEFTSVETGNEAPFLPKTKFQQPTIKMHNRCSDCVCSVQGKYLKVPGVDS